MQRRRKDRLYLSSDRRPNMMAAAAWMLRETARIRLGLSPQELSIVVEPAKHDTTLVLSVGKNYRGDYDLRKLITAAVVHGDYVRMVVVDPAHFRGHAVVPEPLLDDAQGEIVENYHLHQLFKLAHPARVLAYVAHSRDLISSERYAEVLRTIPMRQYFVDDDWAW